MLKQRLITAGILIVAVLLALTWLPALALVVLFALLALATAWEWSAFCGFNATRDRTVFMLSVALGLLAAYGLVTGVSASPLAVAIPAVSWWALTAGEMASGTRVLSRPVGAAVLGFVAVVGCFAAMAWLLERGNTGRGFIVALLAIVWVADSAAYFAGKRFGRTRLAPVLSPNKTVEGVIGALVGVVVVAVVSGLLLWRDADMPVTGWLSLCLVVALVSVVGDVAQSREKRAARVKDSGSLLPGHGGLTDRLDSMMAAAAVYACGLSLPLL